MLYATRVLGCKLSQLRCLDDSSEGGADRLEVMRSRVRMSGRSLVVHIISSSRCLPMPCDVLASGLYNTVVAAIKSELFFESLRVSPPITLLDSEMFVDASTNDLAWILLT